MTTATKARKAKTMPVEESRETIPLAQPMEDAQARLQLLPLKFLLPDPNNARTEAEIEADPATAELAESIKQNGLAQPILVVPSSVRKDHFRIVVGHRRWVACRLAGLVFVNCIIRDLDLAREIALQLVENLQRKDLDPIQEAIAFNNAMQSTGWTQQQLAAKCGKTQGHISNRVRLLELPFTVLNWIRAGRLNATQGRLLAVLSDLPETMTAVMSLFSRELAHDPDGEPLSQDVFEELLGSAVEDTMKPMSGWRAPDFKPTPAQRKALDIRTIDIVGEKEQWAANVTLWEELDAATRTPQKFVLETSTTKVAPLSEKELQARNEQAAAIFNKRILRYKFRWLQLRLAPRLKELTTEQLMVVLVGFAMTGGDMRRTHHFEDAILAVTGSSLKSQIYEPGKRWIELLSIDRAKWPAILLKVIEAWVECEARSHQSDANPDLIETLARELGIELNEKQWGIDDAFLRIHTLDQLADVMEELQITRPEKQLTKSALIEHILENRFTAKNVVVPKALKKVKTVPLD